MRTEDGFHLAPAGLEEAVAATQAVAEGVRGVDLGRPVRAVAAGSVGWRLILYNGLPGCAL